MTTDLIKTLEGLEKKATKGKWVAKFDSCDCGDGYGCSHGSWAHEIVTLDESLKYEKHPKLYPGKLFCKEVIEDMTASVDDGKLIVQLRNSLPQIISALNDAERMREALQAYASRFPCPGILLPDGNTTGCDGRPTPNDCPTCTTLNEKE